MVDFKLDKSEGILTICPQSPLEASDFQRVAEQVDPFVESNGKLRGILINAESFPGWKDFAALVAHFKFVRDHHRKVKKIAAVSDSGFLSIAPKIASHFVQANVRHFPYAEKAEALAWLRE